MSLDQKIFTDFLAGRMEAFYQRLYPGLLLYASRYLGDKDMYSEDCVQNAIFKAWERKENFESEYAFKSFLYITIRNEIISIHRNVSVKAKYLAAQPLIEDSDTFIQSVIDHEAKTMLFNLINELPPRERKVCRMSYIDGLSNSEISETLGLSLATVKRHKARSVELLRTLFRNLAIFAAVMHSSSL